MKPNTKTKEMKPKLTATAPARTKRAAEAKTGQRPIVVTDENVDELCKRLNSLAEKSPEYDRLADALNRYMWS